MKPFFTACLLIALIVSGYCFAQNTLQPRLTALGLKATPVSNSNFKEYYEISVPQICNHAKPGKTFNQRIYLGINDLRAPVVIETDGYAIDYASKPNYTNELATGLNANLLVAEHRFCGRSLPDTANLGDLTLQQAAGDYHYIKELLDTILTGKWVSTGISKGGQAALAYKLYYPKDVAATVVYGAAIKNKQTIYSDVILSNLSKSACGKKINDLQQYLFKNKKELLPVFTAYAKDKGYNFQLLDDEKVFDYLLLELPYSFWQSGSACSEIPSTKNAGELVNYVTTVVSPRYFSLNNKPALEPSFYMFYHELGYYEYNTAPFKAYLKDQTYPNQFFAPLSVNIQFDDSYQKAIQEFIQSPEAETVYFIYGQNDPWALQSIVKRNAFTVKNGSHKSRIKDLPAEQQATLYARLKGITG